MITEVITTRRYNKETYIFKLNKPEYIGEKGILGIEITPYLSIETPENWAGYTDTVLFDHGKAYTLNRYLPNWIKKRIEKVADKIRSNYPYTII